LKAAAILGFLNHNLNLLLNLSGNDGIKIKNNKITIKNQKLTATPLGIDHRTFFIGHWG